MKVTIDIVDRNYEQIKEFCDFNGINIEDYIVECTENDFFIRKYGDLNDKLNNTKTEVEEKPMPQEIKEKFDELAEMKKKEEAKIEKKKVGRPKKKVEEEIKKDDSEELLKNISKNQVFVRQEDIVDTETLKPTKIKRTLKTR